MALGPKLDLRQNQRLTMTPQLRQAISLLQMSNIEISAHIAEEAEKNPLLEVVEPRATEAPVQAGPKEHQAPAGASQQHLPIGAHHASDFDHVQNYRYEPTPREKLRLQIILAERDPDRTKIALALIDELDERGWIAAPMFEIAARFRVTQRSVEAALTTLQSCEPVGVGARNLQECLELQLTDAKMFTPEMQVLTENLDVLAAQDYAKLEKLTELSRDSLMQAIATLQKLNPRPVVGLSNEVVQTAIADVTVIASAAEGWAVELNNDALPRVLVNEHYASEVAKDGRSTTEFLNTCRSNARFLVKAMDQRAKTILRVATVIVRHQSRFFDEGLTGLRPLNLSTVAAELGIHESTVSRVTNGKYLYCLRGTFELRFFFVQGIARNDGGANIAAPLVREKIRQLIEAEQPGGVLSDEKLSKFLQEDGVDVARRTVAKYREAMGIPSSNRRRKMHR